jgi:hypothetical protein
VIGTSRRLVFGLSPPCASADVVEIATSDPTSAAAAASLDIRGIISILLMQI